MKNILLLLLLLFIPLIDLFHPGFPITHDGPDHVARIANFYQNIQEGVLIPRWAGNLNWGYGHPVLMFLYPLPSYLASLFHLFGFSFVDSVKIIFGLSFVASGLTMYLWLQSFLPKRASTVGAALYTFAPYHFVDIYIRGALGELVAFIFPPLVLYFLFKLSQQSRYRYLIGGTLSLAGFILAHNAISLMFLPFILFYIVYVGMIAKQKKLFVAMVSLLFFFSFCLSAFFWLPAVVEGKYTLRDIVTEHVYADRFTSLSTLFFSPWRYGESGAFTLQVGLLQWLGVIGGLLVTVKLYKNKKKEWLLLGGILCGFFFSLFLMIDSSTILWDHISILQKFQFPWRFLLLSIFLSAVLGAFAFTIIPKKYLSASFILFVLLLVLLTKDMWHAKGYIQKPESFYTGIYQSTTDTGESSPIWSVRFMEQFPKKHIEVIDGKATVKEIMRTSTKHSYTITTSEKATMRENTLYFPGWQVLVDGITIPVEFQDINSRGLMTFAIKKGKHAVTVQFVETKLRQFSNIVSLGSLFALLISGILMKKFYGKTYRRIGNL